jgi:putative phosphoribosyl transferase
MERKSVIVRSVTHLFKEPEALEQVAELARDWFMKHLAAETTNLSKEEHL